jgi:hypothetical protein
MQQPHCVDSGFARGSKNGSFPKKPAKKPESQPKSQEAKLGFGFLWLPDNQLIFECFLQSRNSGFAKNPSILWGYIY